MNCLPRHVPKSLRCVYLDRSATCTCTELLAPLTGAAQPLQILRACAACFTTDNDHYGWDVVALKLVCRCALLAVWKRADTGSVSELRLRPSQPPGDANRRSTSPSGTRLKGSSLRSCGMRWDDPAVCLSPAVLSGPSVRLVPCCAASPDEATPVFTILFKIVSGSVEHTEVAWSCAQRAQLTALAAAGTLEAASARWWLRVQGAGVQRLKIFVSIDYHCAVRLPTLLAGLPAVRSISQLRVRADPDVELPRTAAPIRGLLAGVARAVAGCSCLQHLYLAVELAPELADQLPEALWRVLAGARALEELTLSFRALWVNRRHTPSAGSVTHMVRAWLACRGCAR